MKNIIYIVLVAFAEIVFAQASKAPQKSQMQFFGAFESGQQGASIYKMFDPTEDVLCYILMADVAGKKQTENGLFIFEGNNVGSISCMKARALPVVVPKQVK